MASSVEEGEIVADRVKNYYFVNSKEVPVSFSSLPLQWSNVRDEGCSEKKVESPELAFLRGMVEDGLLQIYKKVVAWKFELSYVLPEIYVRPDVKYGRWIMLQRPQKCYEDIVRTALVSVHCLHFIKKKSEESVEALWKRIRKTFSAYEIPPSVKDLVDHMQWIKEAALRDKDIAKAENLPMFLDEMSGKRKSFCEDDRTRKKPKFDEYEDDVDSDDDNYISDAENDELFDCVCALCDDGGDILGYANTFGL